MGPPVPQPSVDEEGQGSPEVGVNKQGVKGTVGEAKLADGLLTLRSLTLSVDVYNVRLFV